jgi:carboxymethylenebutenolidase
MRPALKFLLALTLLAVATASLPCSLLAQDWAKAALEKSPRHREYVSVKHDGRTIQAYVAYPEISQKAPVVLMIHEIFGLSDWAKLMADELAAKGYIVIAPDLLTGLGPNGGGTDSMAQDAVTKAVSGLDPAQVTADLDAAADYAKKLPSANGKLFVAGFCWGGGKSFAYATHRHDLSAAFVFYGTPPPDVTSITAPVYGFYAGNDNRVTSTVPAATDAMKAAGKKYDPVIYDGAGHGFMRAGQDPAPAASVSPEAVAANKKAWNESFARMTTIITKINAGGTALRTQPRSRTNSASLKAASLKPASTKTAASSCHEVAPAGASIAQSQTTPAMNMPGM